jgi:monovalent cation:H+ antiporter-2, CPA2 family
MVHLPELIKDLALILMAAGTVALLFRKLGQPVVLGYIIAGLLIGPHIPLTPTVVDIPNVQIWAEIGVIFLLFALGLEFSFKKLAQVGGAASITALVEVSGMTALGFITGRLLGWNSFDSLFLGGVLAISSTTIIIRAFDELGVKGRGFVSLVFGILIVEDLFAILLLVLLSTLAARSEFSGMEMARSALSLVFFVVLWFLSGIFLLPSLFKKLKAVLNEETLLVFSLGLCFLMVVVTTKAGFSPALGAFIMGSILAETAEGQRIEHLVKPVKDLFGAIFFVSVGMLIDPKALHQHAGPIALITFVTIVGKFFTTLLGALVSGRSLRHSMQAGLSLAQIGEFSFIIAGLGLTLKVTSDFLYPIAVGVSAITTFSTPYLIRSADGLYRAAKHALPEKALAMIESYSSSTQKVSGNRSWREITGAYALHLLANGVVISAIFLFLAKALPPFLGQYVESPGLAGSLSLVVASLASAPFFWAILAIRPKQNLINELWAMKEYRSTILMLEMIRLAFVTALFGVLASRFIAPKMAAVVTVFFSLGCFFVFSRHLKRVYTWLERRVINNLSDVKEQESIPVLAPWDAHISHHQLSPNSEAAGKTLAELKAREAFGVCVTSITRGQRLISAPGASDQLFPGDRVSFIGTEEQIERFVSLLEPKISSPQNTPRENHGLQPLRITEKMPFAHKSIRDSGIRERMDGLVVGLEREGKRILNPDSSFELKPGDLLWVVGDRGKIASI